MGCNYLSMHKLQWWFNWKWRYRWKITSHCFSVDLINYPCHNPHIGLVNSMWPSDTTRRHRSASILIQVMACCLTASSHYLHHRWLLIKKVYWHSYEGDFARDILAMTYPNFHSNAPGANELISVGERWPWCLQISNILNTTEYDMLKLNNFMGRYMEINAKWCLVSWLSKCWIIGRKHKDIHVFTISVISRNWTCTSSCNLLSWKTGLHVSSIVNAMAADGLATQGTRASEAIVLTLLSQNIPTSASEG